jgi:hypothetical protein
MKRYDRKYISAVAKHGALQWGDSRTMRTYFIQGRTTGLVKIGRTVGSVQERLPR